MLAKEEVQKVREEKQRDLDELQKRLDDLETKTSIEREQSSNLISDYERQLRMEGRSNFTNPILRKSPQSQQITKDRLKAKFRSRAKKKGKDISSKASGTVYHGSMDASESQEEYQKEHYFGKPPIARSYNRGKMNEEEMCQRINFYERSLRAVT